MQRYSLKPGIQAIVFDIDGTLYDSDEYMLEQAEMHYCRTAVEWGITVDEARGRVKQWRDDYAAENDGKHQSMGNTLAGLGIPIATTVRWRCESLKPEEYLQHDADLCTAIGRLAEWVRLIAVTNNPESVGRATLEVLGVSEFLPEIIGLDTTGFSKPSVQPFEEALARLGSDPQLTVSVGDRYDLDIAPALQVGMAGILVDGVGEVHGLAQFLGDQGFLGRL